MNTEKDAWDALVGLGASMIKPGFADRVLRAARARQSPLIVAHFALCAATAALCLGLVVALQYGHSGDDNAANVAGWNEIAQQASELEQGI
ncbi:MAG TPA: hypothetical protein VGG34_09260 [Opitutaceae bacterium]|jgi:hypothetical protein